MNRTLVEYTAFIQYLESIYTLKGLVFMDNEDRHTSEEDALKKYIRKKLSKNEKIYKLTYIKIDTI